MKMRTAVIAVALALYPGVALADVGSPLILGGGFHLFIGNVFLGLLEAYILARLFGLKGPRCAALLIPANYLSSWVGLFYVIGVLKRWLNPDLYSGARVFLVLVAVTYVLTLFLEWPFVALCFKGTERWFGKSVKGSLIVQTASYAVLVGCYALVSGTSLYTSLSVVPRLQVALPDRVQVFYISAADGDVYRLTGRAAPAKVYAFRSTSDWDSLALRASEQDAGVWDLIGVRPARSGAERSVVVVPGVVRTPRDSVWNSQGDSERAVGEAAFRIGAAAASPWFFRAAYWSDMGMQGRNRRTGETLRLAFGTPLMEWPVWHPIQLPEDKVLFQLSRDQICLLEVTTRRVAMLARGRGLIALIGEPGDGQRKARRS